MAQEPSDAQKPGTPEATDEDILRLRSKIDRELAMVTQKLVDAEESIIDMEMAVRGTENGSRPRAQSAPPSDETSTDKITARLKVVGSGLNKIKEWVVKPKEAEGQPGPEGKPEQKGDLEERLDEALKIVSHDIREREKDAMDLDRKLHEAQKELIGLRAQEQQVREMQLRVGQTKQLTEDLERKMAVLDDMVRSYEASTKKDTGIRTKPKDPSLAPPLPKFEDRLTNAINEALKAVTAQEKKVAEIENQLGHANTSLVEERTRQQRIRSMQMKLRQSRHFSIDLHRSLSAMASAIEELRIRAGNLLKPEARMRDKLKKAPEPAAQAPAPTKATTS